MRVEECGFYMKLSTKKNKDNYSLIKVNILSFLPAINSSFFKVVNEITFSYVHMYHLYIFYKFL